VLAEAPQAYAVEKTRRSGIAFGRDSDFINQSPHENTGLFARYTHILT